MIPAMKLRRGVALLVLLVTAVTACSDGGEATSGTEAAADVILGSGSVPETVPEDFPIPDEASVMTTLVNRPEGTTEMTVRFPVEVTVVASYYEQNLAARDYTISRSEARPNGGWEIEIAKGDVVATLRLDTIDPSTAEAVMIFEE